METRLDIPQAMLLVVPNGKVKLLNALPFAPADLRRDSLEQAWHAYREAWRTTEVRDFVLRCRSEPALLRHANETWALALERMTKGPGRPQPLPARRARRKHPVRQRLSDERRQRRLGALDEGIHDGTGDALQGHGGDAVEETLQLS